MASRWTWSYAGGSSSTASRARITSRGAAHSWKSASRSSRASKPEKARGETMLRIIAAVVAALSLPALAAWPERPIKLLIGYAPGGSTDVVARVIQPKLGEKLGQPVIIENKPGAAGDFAAELMLQSAPDGYTLMMTTVAVHAINPGLMKQKFDPINDFTPMALVCSYPMILIGSPQTTFKSPAELKALAAKQPTFYSSSGVGSP